MPNGRLALIVAADEFEDRGLAALVAPRRDAADLARALADPDIGGFEVKTIVNRPRHEVERAIARFFTAGQRDETLLLYFSGHGLKDENGMLYFAMADTELDLLSASAVSSSFVSGQLGRARAQTKIVLLDCCYSGAFSRSLTTKDDRRVDAAEELRGIGRVIITASNALQYSFEGSTPSGDARQSVFTKHLVAGLETGAADLDGDGRIAVDELYRYVHDQVVQENPQQRPSISIETQGMVVVASSRAGIRPAVLPEELLSALANALPRVRLGATADLADILHGTDLRMAAAARAVLHGLLDDDSRRVAEAAGAALATEAMSGTSIDPVPLGQPPGSASPEPASPEPACPGPVSRPSPPTPAGTDIGGAPGKVAHRMLPRLPLWMRPVGMAMVGLAGVLLIITLTTTPWHLAECPSTAAGLSSGHVPRVAEQVPALAVVAVTSTNGASTSVPPAPMSLDDPFRSVEPTTTSATQVPTSSLLMSPTAYIAEKSEQPGVRTGDCGASPSGFLAAGFAGVAVLLAGTWVARRSTMSPWHLVWTTRATVISAAAATVAVVGRIRADGDNFGSGGQPGRVQAVGLAVVALVGALLALRQGADHVSDPVPVLRQPPGSEPAADSDARRRANS